MIEAGVFALFTYLVAAVPTGPILATLYADVDITAAGSGNTGATNVHRLLGPRFGLATLLGDLAKGCLPVLLASAVSDWEHFPSVIADRLRRTLLAPVSGVQGRKGSPPSWRAHQPAVRRAPDSRCVDGGVLAGRRSSLAALMLPLCATLHALASPRSRGHRRRTDAGLVSPAPRQHWTLTQRLRAQDGVSDPRCRLRHARCGPLHHPCIADEPGRSGEDRVTL